MHVRYPVWLQTAQQRPGASVFATMFALESIARSVLATVITVQGLRLFNDVRDLSLVFSGVGCVGLAASFSIPWLVGRFSRRWIYTVGGVLLAGAALALATVTVTGQVVGMFLRVFGTACLSITLSLFVLQYIRRSELTVSEPKRVQYSAIAWTVGPALGVFLYREVGTFAPFALSAIAAAALLGLFWFLRLQERRVVAPAVSRPSSPWRSVPRFLRQPRLRLAWFIVFARSTWWVFFFIYGAAYAVRSGLGEMVASLVISAGNGMLFAAPWIGRFAIRHGVAAVLRFGFVLCGGATLLAALAFATPPVVVAALLLAALGAVCLDSVGNILFLCAVRPGEREAMTTVFRTYLDVSELLPPALFALVLSYFDLAAVFWLVGAAMLLMLPWLRFVPARLGRARIVAVAEESVPRVASV